MTLTSRGLRRTPWLLPAGTALLLANTAYLAATASPTLFYFANVVVHMALGLVLGFLYGRRRLSSWRRLNWFARMGVPLAAYGGAGRREGGGAGCGGRRRHQVVENDEALSGSQWVAALKKAAGVAGQYKPAR